MLRMMIRFMLRLRTRGLIMYVKRCAFYLRFFILDNLSSSRNLRCRIGIVEF